MPEIRKPQSAVAIFEREKNTLLSILSGVDKRKWEEFMLVALRNPAISQRCTPESIVSALYTNARLALPLDGVHAALVPFGRECVHVTGYPGYVSLYVRHANVTHVDAEIVFKGDTFKVTKGTDPKIVHEVDEGVPRTAPEDVVAAYAVAHLTNGTYKSWVMWRDELDALRDLCRQKSKGKQSPWDGGASLIEMWRKSPIIRLRKGLKMTDELQSELAKQEREEIGTPIDVPGETVKEVKEVSSIDELIAANRNAAQDDTYSEQGDGTAIATAEEIPPVRDVAGLPVDSSVEREWDKIRTQKMGGEDQLLAVLTPDDIASAYASGDQSPKVRALRDRVAFRLKQARELYGKSGEMPSRRAQILALAAEAAELGEGF